MPTLKPGTIWPTPEEEAMIQAGIDADPDNPEWTAEDFARARPASEVLPPEVYAALTDQSRPVTVTLVSDAQDRARQKRMGRPPLANPKTPTTIRLDTDVLNALRRAGRGWQTRVNALLREAVEAGKL